MKSCLHGALVFLAGYLFAFGAQGAEPNFEKIRPEMYYTNGWSGLYLEGDTPCQDIADANNAQPDRGWDYLNSAYNSTVGDEGCDYVIRRLSDDYTVPVHYFGWAGKIYSCPNDYTGPHEDGNGGQECRRAYSDPTVKPQICPSCVVGNPIDVAASDKVLTIEDIPLVDGLGFRRTYHSVPRVFTEGQPASLGLAWSSDHGQLLRFAAGDAAFSARTHMVRPDGSIRMYMKSDSSGVWTSEQDDRRDTLSEVVLDNGFPGYLLELANGDREFYSDKGVHLETRMVSGDILSYDYATNGRLVKVRNSKGRYLEFFYNANKRLERVTSSSGQSVEYAYNADKLLESANYGSYLEKYLYTSASGIPSYLVRIEDGAGNEISSYTYDTQRRTASTQRAGGVNRFTADYDDAWMSNVLTTTPLNSTVRYFYRLLLGRRVVDLIEESCPGCTTKSESFLYDNNLNIVENTIGPSKTCRSYEQARNLESVQVDGASASFYCATMSGIGFSRRTTSQWHPIFRVPTERNIYNSANQLVSQSTWSYNARGQALTATQTDPVTTAVRTHTTTYCESADITNGTCPLLGLVKSVNGPRTDVTDTATYTYYASDDASCASSPTTCPHRKGDLWKVTDALGRITETLAYDGAGRPLSVKDANGVITDMTYHPRGWLTARKVRGTNNAVETDDQITQIEYWPTGLVKKVTQPDGAFTAYTYDAAHRLTDIADNAGNTIHYTLDNAGNRTAEDTKDSGSTLRRTLSRVYNQLGQLQTAQDAYNHATGFTYDANGNNQLVTDALSRVTDNDYDPLNRLARTLQDVGGIAAETKFEYDALDNLTKVTDPKGLDTTYQYNGFGDLTQLASPDTGTSTYAYDSAGNRKTQTDARGIVSTYSYDALNRLTGIAYPTSSLNVGYIYDTANPVCIAGETFAIGRLSKMTDSSGDTQYCYDRFGNLTRKRQTTNAKVFTLRYAYTLAGQLQAITYPDGAVVDYIRDGQGRITEVGATPAGGTRQILLNQATYHPFGPIAGWVYGNGRTMSRPLNQNYQPTAVADNATGGMSLGYEFDAVGNLSKLYNADQSVTKAQYVYDALNRLADVKDGPTGTVIEHYGYDATGNRTSFTNAGGTTSYTYPTTSHRLTQVGATARTYDNVGNTTQIGGTAKEFVYNDAGRMSQVKASGTATMNYQLNGRGEQVRKYLNTANTYTVYDEVGRWVGDYDNSGNALQQAIWLDNLPVALLVSNQLKYLQPDHLGTPRSVIDPTPNVVIWRWNLEGDAFGNTAPNQDPDSNGTSFVFNMRFPGQRHDSASGLNYNYFRNYDAATGRYIESDLIGLNGGAATYSYVGAAPMNFYDLQGLERCVGIVTKKEWIGSSFERSRQIGDSKKIFRICSYNLRVSTSPTLIDYTPDPIKYAKNQFPFGLPLDLEWYCGWIWKDRMRLDRVQQWRENRFQVCTDDCGITTLKPLPSYDGEDIELIKYFNSYWRDDQMMPFNSKM